MLTFPLVDVALDNGEPPVKKICLTDRDLLVLTIEERIGDFSPTFRKIAMFEGSRFLMPKKSRFLVKIVLRVVLKKSVICSKKSRHDR